MKIIPKFNEGSYFTVYTPISEKELERARISSSSKRSSSESDFSSKSSSKGGLTEKDFYNMLKDIDGLPNEMKAVVDNLMNTLSL